MTLPHLRYDDLYDINYYLTKLEQNHPQLENHINAIRTIIPVQNLETISNIISYDNTNAHALSLCEAIYIPTGNRTLIINVQETDDSPRIYIYPYQDAARTRRGPFYASPDELHLTSTRYQLPPGVRAKLAPANISDLRSKAATAYNRSNLNEMLDNLQYHLDDIDIDDTLRTELTTVIDTLYDRTEQHYETMATRSSKALAKYTDDGIENGDYFWTYFMCIAYLNNTYPLILIDYNEDTDRILAFDPLHRTLNHYYPHELVLSDDTARAIEFAAH